MGLFDGLGDMLSGLMPGGIPPQAAAPNPSPLGVASESMGGIVRGLGAPSAATPGGAPELPASSAAPDGVRPAASGALMVGGASTPPDLSSLYTRLLSQERSRRDVDSGLALMASAFASPQAKSALINYAGRPQDQEGSASSQLATLTSLYNNSLKMQQYRAMLSRIPQLAKQLGMPESQVQSLIETGQIGDVLKQRGEVKGAVVENADGTHAIVDTQHGDALSNNFGPAKTQIATNAEGQPVSVIPSTGQQVGQPVGPAKTDLPTDKQRILQDSIDNPDKYSLPPNEDQSQSAQLQRAKFRQSLFSPNMVTINNAQETEYEKKMGSGRGDMRVQAIKDGEVNRQLVQNLDVLSDALNRADKSGNLTTGPFAQKALEMKETLASTLGLDLKGVPEAEVAAHMQTQIATQSAKALTARPSQMEFAKYLTQTPGASMTVAGAQAQIDIMRQEAQAKIEIARAADDPNDKRSITQIADEYYKSHPILSPFDHSKPLGVDDILKINPPPQAYIDRLRAGQGKPEDFDNRFGPGASQRYLNNGAAPTPQNIERMRLREPLNDDIGPAVPPKFVFGRG